MEEMELRDRTGRSTETLPDGSPGQGTEPSGGSPAQGTGPSGGAPRGRALLLSAALVLVIAAGALAYRSLSSGVSASQIRTAPAAAPETIAGGETVAAETAAGGKTAAAGSVSGGEASAAETAGKTAAEETAGEAAKESEANGQETVYAPDFTVYDAEGTPHTLSSFRGTPVVLNFWASWCPPCRSEMPDFDAAYAEYGDRVRFVMVNMTDGKRETVETASAFIEKQGYSFPVYYDTDMDAAYTYGVSSIPTSYFIGAEGAVTAWGMGALSAGDLDEAIKMILP